ncbi:MAG: hypothetical protein LBH43_16100 [Treponema sp.]|jgi:hypothetical protein|nr:hypothetical protein [Treponema sp.]
MKKGLKIAVISAAAALVITGALFLVIPPATSKEAEARLGEFFSEVGVSEDMWSVDKAYYIPLLGHFVAQQLEIGERGSGGFLKVKKFTAAVASNRKGLFAGSLDAQDISLSIDGIGIRAKGLSVKNISVDKALLGYAPEQAVKKLGKISLSDTVLSQRGQAYFSLGKINANLGYAEGKFMLSSSLLIKDFVTDLRQFMPLPALRPEYRISSLELKNSFSGDVYTSNLFIDGVKLLTLDTALGVSLPRELLEYGKITNLDLFDYEDVKIHSFTLTYTDKSFLNHLFELAGMPGGRESAAEELKDTLMMYAMTGEADEERLADEIMKFIAKPGKFTLKSNLKYPLSLEEISRNPFAMKLSLSLNGGKPFTMSEY